MGFLKRFKENFVDTSYIGTMVGGIIHDISLYAPEKYAKELGIEMDAYEETELDVECRIMLTHWAKKLSEERYQYRKVREEIMSKAMSISEEYFLRDRFKRDISTPKENFRQVFLEAWAQYEEVESMREFIATVSYRICTRVLGLDITKESNKEVFNKVTELVMQSIMFACSLENFQLIMPEHMVEDIKSGKLETVKNFV